MRRLHRSQLAIEGSAINGIRPSCETSVGTVRHLRWHLDYFLSRRPFSVSQKYSYLGDVASISREMISADKFYIPCSAPRLFTISIG